ncbi:hypothetical protein ACFFKU_10230 [Kineococcus gynurae]|uniref:Uncharacterized protein n=1 Tax=Kineococcus gynurae TaxID=452979 RepID=A0ABV5LV13_9ACTN
MAVVVAGVALTGLARSAVVGVGAAVLAAGLGALPSAWASADATLAVAVAAVVAGAVVAVVTGGIRAFALGPPRPPRRVVVLPVLLGASAWPLFELWWPTAEENPTRSPVLGLLAVAVLVVGVLVAELGVRPFAGPLLVVPPLAAMAFGPAAASDPLGAVAWAMLVLLVLAAAFALTGAVALGRWAVLRAGSRRAGSAVPRR